MTETHSPIPPGVSAAIPENINPYYKRPNFIRVVMTTPENKQIVGCAGTEECIRRIDFLEYCKNILANEWMWDSPDEALRAGAMAIKKYSWYRVVVDPQSGTGDADVVDVPLRPRRGRPPLPGDQKYTADLSHISSQPGGKEWLERVESVFHDS